MTLQQLEYLIAVDTWGQFSVAASHCFVSQPSLSAMIKKLEDELGVTLFDRRQQPVTTTEVGAKVVAQARTILKEAEMLRQIVQIDQDIPTGHLKLGIIPTIAPYLLPLFIEAFSETYPHIRLDITENTTENLERNLRQGTMDTCILATAVMESQMECWPLFSEDFVVYAPHESKILEKKYILAGDLDPERVVLLEEGHCIREQAINLCSLQHAKSRLNNIHFEAGNLETLRRLVESYSGIAILPQLSLLDLDEDRIQNVRFFKDPAPKRDIILVTNQKCPKRRLTNALIQCILSNLPKHFLRV